MNFKNIHIGSLIEIRWKEQGIPMERTCNFFKLTEDDVRVMFQKEKLDTDILLRWSKLLEYDFFRIYSQYLILYSPPSSMSYIKKKAENMVSYLPEFKKNIYTQEIIDFLLELLSSGEKTKQEIINEYRIPKTTLYKWVSKYKKN